MISSDAIVEWRGRVGFARSEQVEQDLVLSRLIVEIANDELLGEELIFSRRDLSPQALPNESVALQRRPR